MFHRVRTVEAGDRGGSGANIRRAGRRAWGIFTEGFPDDFGVRSILDVEGSL
jgi:hypothetical protein